jgi:hypothetical protein
MRAFFLTNFEYLVNHNIYLQPKKPILNDKSLILNIISIYLGYNKNYRIGCPKKTDSKN